MASDTRATDDELIAAMVSCEQITRELEQLSLVTLMQLDRRGSVTERGYGRPAGAAADLLGWDIATANRRVRIAAEITDRVAVDGQPLPPLLPATAKVFGTGEISLRHIEVISDALRTAAAKRLDPELWATAEEQLAHHAREFRPGELANFARNLINALDQDGPAPGEDDPPQPNELFLSRTGPDGGGRIRGRLDALTYAAVATALDAMSKPGPDDPRTHAERQADALGEICHHALDEGTLPEFGGERPHVTVTMGLADLESRVRSGSWTSADSSRPRTSG